MRRHDARAGVHVQTRKLAHAQVLRRPPQRRAFQPVEKGAQRSQHGYTLHPLKTAPLKGAPRKSYHRFMDAVFVIAIVACLLAACFGYAAMYQIGYKAGSAAIERGLQDA